MTLFVIGKPIKHSLSPLIHNYWINKYQLGLEYKKMEVEKESLPSLIENIREGKITGLNITLPYKKDIISYIDEVSYSAKDIGAINTVFFGEIKFMVKIQMELVLLEPLKKNKI